MQSRSWRRNRLGRRQLFILMLVLLSCFAGCGIKSPPLPPVQEMPNPVTDLRQTITDNVVTLTWSAPGEKENAVVERFSIFRSKIGLDADCPECPLMYETAANINAGSESWQGKAQETISYSEELETGYRYSYKVVGYTRDLVASADSNPVGFDF